MTEWRYAALLGVAIAGGSLTLVPHAAGATDPAFGYWLTANGKAIIEVGPCGDRACGHMAWLEEPRDQGGMLKRDTNNPDQRLRDRPLCGLRILRGFTLDEPGSWQDGEIYSPRHGSVFSASMTADRETDVLEVRGYVGISLFGDSQEWTRVASDRGGCERG